MSSDDSEDEVKPKKAETKKVQKKSAGEIKVPKPGAPEPPKTKTGKVAKPPSKAGATAPPEDAEGEPAPEKPKTATGKVKKPLGKSDAAGKTGAKPKRAPGPPPPPPATRGGLDYGLAALAPLAAGGLGAFAFLTLTKAVALANNPVLQDKYGDSAAAIAKACDVEMFVKFPWAPIASGAVVGLLATLCFLKMAPGIGARLMGGGMMAFAILSTLPFLLAGNSMQAKAKGELLRIYPIPRGQDVDPRLLDFKSPDYEVRSFLATWAVDLDGGDVPLSWIATSDDRMTAQGAPEDEAKIKFADLRIALAKGRELEKAKKVDAEIWKKVQALRDKANQEISMPGEETANLDHSWNIFKAKAQDKLAKPPAPKNAAWFSHYSTWEQMVGHQGTSQDDRAYYERWYFGKAIHAACKDLPADMRFAGCFRGEVKDDAPAEGLTRYDFVWLCYDLEKPDREPVVLPHLSALVKEARFKIEILGEKGPSGGGGAAPPKEAPKEAPKEEPAKDAPKEAPKEAPKDAPKEAPKEAPKPADDERPKAPKMDDDDRPKAPPKDDDMPKEDPK
jgi:hypothetical protein